MKPLLFLTGRTFVNRFRQAFTSPKRLISLLAVCLYWLFLLMRPMGGDYSGRHHRLTGGLTFDLPPMIVIQAFAFAGFAVLTLLLALSSSVQRLVFRPADVDVLFATPLNPKIVLLFRFFRDYLISLLIPLLPLIFSWRPTAAGLEFLFRNVPHPHSAAYVFRAASLAWILVALTWVSITYAINLFINRSDLVSDRNRRILTYGGSAGFLLLAGYIAWKFSIHKGLDGFVEVTQDHILRTVLFTATAASSMVMAPLEGDWLPFFTSALGLLAIAGGAVLIATSQAGWMYDQAAARGFDSLRLRSLQQKGDFVGMAAERARSRKTKTRRYNWAMRVRAKGPLAIIWREVLIQLRMAPIMLAMFAVLGVLFAIIPMIAAQGDKGEAGFLFMAMQSLAVFIGSMSISQSGFIELLRRVDIEKPLPFTPAVISFTEVAAKALPSFLSVLVASIVTVIVAPSLWAYCIATIIGLPFVAILCSSIVFIVTLIFPDLDDPTLRGFRGLMILLGLGIALVPVGLASIGVFFLTRDFVIAPMIAAAVAAGLSVAASTVICFVAGNLYAQFNPSE